MHWGTKTIKMVSIWYPSGYQALTKLYRCIALMGFRGCSYEPLLCRAGPASRAGFQVPRSRFTYCLYINLGLGSYEKRASPVCRDLA
jgi:hypothetical protein